MSHIYKELSGKISITEWQCILKPTVIANKSDLSIGAGVFIHNKMSYDIIYYTGVIICDAMHFFQANTNWSAIGNHTKTDTKWAGLYVYTRWYLHPKIQRGTVIKRWPQCLQGNVVDCTIFWGDDTQNTML